VVDINKFTSKVQAHIIVSQLVGKEYCFKKLEYTNLDTGEAKFITIGEFMDVLIDDSIKRITQNPLIAMSEFFAEKEIFTIDTRFIKNARSLRGFMTQIINDKRKLNDPEACDIISLLLGDENYQNTDELIDDVLVMFIAGSKTVQNTTTNLITTLLHEPDQMARMRATVDPFMAKVSDNIMEKMTMDSVEEAEYIKMAYQEVMRRDAPLQASSTSCMSKDIKICGVEMKKGEAFFVDILALHNDKEQWRQPELFVPDRFDPSSEWYLKPDGGKRSHFAYVPFLGGTRVCLGKTFAEVTLRFTVPLWFHFFDFAFTKEEHKKERPALILGAYKSPEIPLKLTNRNKVADLPNFQIQATN